MKRRRRNDKGPFPWGGPALVFLTALGPGFPAAAEAPAAETPEPALHRTAAPADERELKWGRNPFAFPRKEQAEVPAKVEGPGDLELTAIFYHEDQALAIIGHRIVRRGDRIEGKKIMAIEKNRVLLKDGAGLQELKLQPFDLQPQEKEGP